VRRGDPLVDGPRVPHDILKVLGVEALSDYLVNEIQDVYRLQGVKINDKHIEVIVRQMLQKVEITDPRRYDLPGRRAGGPDRVRPHQQPSVEGRQASRSDAGAARHHQGLAANQQLHQRGVVPGDDTGFDRGLDGGQDRQSDGLKENVIVGRLIPAGTGAVMNRLRAIAAGRDQQQVGGLVTPPRIEEAKAAE